METPRTARVRTSFEENTIPFERLNMLCDGIFAIAMTLLVLDIKVPDTSRLESSATFSQAFGVILTKSLFYLLTFIIIAGYWMGHRHLMTFIKRQDWTFTILTFLFLAFVVFFPVSFNVLISSGAFPEVIIFYTLVLTGCGFFTFLLWFYASWQHKLIDPALSREEITSRSISFLITPVYFSLSLLLLLIPGIEVHVVFYSWVFIPAFVRAVYFVRYLSEKRLQEHKAEAAAKAEKEIVAAARETEESVVNE